MGESEEVVMTAARRDGKALIRLERMLRSQIDLSKVHHVAGGPYRGILINKIASDLDNVEPSEGRLEFMAYMVNEDHNNETVQDNWTLRFWFRGRADGVTKKKTFTSYFQDLMDPENFPRNYVGIVKKSLVLLKSYPLIKRVELIVQQTDEPGPDESLPPIRSFVSVFTPESYMYQFVPEIPVSNKTFLTFMIKAGSNAHIAISAVYGDVDRKTFEIEIGGDGNTKSFIRDGSMGPIRAEALTMNVLSAKEFRYFWVSWAGHHIEVGRGAHFGYGRFLHWRVPPNRQFNVNCLAVSTGGGSRGQWEFAELLEDNLAKGGKEAKKARAKVSLLWIAKKQRILQCLEDAYPNSLHTSELMRQCKIKQSDMITLAVFLEDLQKKNLIRQIGEGQWMRIQSKGERETGHEIKLVKDFPQLTGQEQPTIAIITALYCEKLAVDVMMEEKTTFVKYKAEGESQVYTIGRIGDYRVVSTKLSRMPGVAQAGTISAENTVTRLLGTFNRVEHVLLVGVGGAVPNYTEHMKHVRLGDVVVSTPNSRTGSLYIHCDKVEKVPDTDGYSYITRGWGSRNPTLQRVLSQLRDAVEADPLTPPPWDENIEEAKEILKGEESNFFRPSLRSDRLFYHKPDGTSIQVEHPRPNVRQSGFGATYREGQPNIKYGTVGSGRLVSRAVDVRRDFANLNGIKAFDTEYESVLESLEGNRCNSFLAIRGMADYVDGNIKEWQPYASLAAAGYMKALIMAM